MSNVSMPAPGTVRGRVLSLLRQNKDGADCASLMKTFEKTGGGVASVNKIQSAVHGLRSMGHRIDFVEGKYHYLGEGISFTTLCKSKSPRRVAVNAFKRTASQGRKPMRVATTQDSTFVREVPQEPPEDTVKRLFVIDQGVLEDARRSLPKEHAAALDNLVERAEAYNAAISLFQVADRTLKGILDL